MSMRREAIAWILPIVILIAGCSFEVPVRQIYWGKVSVSKEGAKADKDGNYFFTSLDWQVSSNSPVLIVRMPDGKFLRTDEMRTESFAPYVASGVASLGKGWDVTVNYPRGRILVSLGDDGSAARMQLWHFGHGDASPSASPAFRPVTTDKLLVFPVSEKDLKKAFGEPSSVKTVMHNT